MPENETKRVGRRASLLAFAITSNPFSVRYSWPVSCSFFRLLTPHLLFHSLYVHYANEPQSVGTEASLTPRRLVPPLPSSSHSFLSLPDSFSLFSRLILPSLHCSRSSSRCTEATVLVGFRLTFRASCTFFRSFSSESRGRVNVRFHGETLDRGYSLTNRSIRDSVSVQWLWFFFSLTRELRSRWYYEDQCHERNKRKKTSLVKVSFY